MITPHLESILVRVRPAIAAAIISLSISPVDAADMIGNCEVTGTRGSIPFTPVEAGELTVEVSLPAPGWWNGDAPELIKDGYEYCMAANIAHRGGLDKVKVVNVAWDALVAGQTKDFDLSLSGISITDERKKVVDFSIPYFNSDIGVLVKKGVSVDSDSIKKMRIGVQQASTGADFVANTLKPAESKVYPDGPSMWAALAAGQVDAAMTDTANVLAVASQSNGTLVAAGQYSTGETYGAIYPKNSPNAATIDKIIDALIKDGTLQQISAKYLAAAWGADPAKVPYLKP